MKLIHSHTVQAAKASSEIVAALDSIAEDQLRDWVERISMPRHFEAEPDQNCATADWLADEFETMGYQTERQGPFNNIVARPTEAFEEVILVGAHYDSVPGCPGADDNGSAVAALLGCAAACALWKTELPVVFVAFNCEEMGFVGSRDFVEAGLPDAPFRVRCAHVLEMLGYASSAKGSQRLPTGLPIRLSDTGDFLGLLSNDHSASFMESIVCVAGTYVPDLPVTGLTVSPGAERALPVLARSDHVPFWARSIPAVMWTDTAEFRNPNYHQPTDTADTLDYPFLHKVTQVLTAAVIGQAVFDHSVRPQQFL
jgi:Zn-dependent M28 family amino/carboxypeptidase